MTLALAPLSPSDLADLNTLAHDAQTYIAHAKSANTRRAYNADWRDFAAWCAKHNTAALPAAPGTVALYLMQLAKRCKVTTLERRIAAISYHHAQARATSPTASIEVDTIMDGIRRTLGTAQTAKAAACTDDIKLMLDHVPPTLLGIRDRALLLVGFAGAFRRSELVSLNVADIVWGRQGLVITIRHSKTDQYAQGQVIGIPRGQHKATCPARSLEAWLREANITDGPIFRSVNRHGQLQPARLSDKAVALVVKRYAAAAGLDASQYAGHSLRAGLATSAAQAGAEERQIMKQTRHRSEKMVRRYIRDGQLFDGNAAGQVGL